MRRRIALLLAATTIAMSTSVLTAGVAEARRNVGGNVPAGATCYAPGKSEARSAQAAARLACFCYVAPPPQETPTGDGQRRNLGGTGPAGDTNCPPGVLKNGTATPAPPAG